MNLFKQHEFNVILPIGFAKNVSIVTKQNNSYRTLVATNDECDTLKIPLPEGDWQIGKYYEDGKTITLRHYARRRTFFSPWF